MKEVKVKSYTRRTKSGKTITVRAHTAKRECGSGKVKGSGKEYSKKKGNSWDGIEDPDERKRVQNFEEQGFSVGEQIRNEKESSARRAKTSAEKRKSHKDKENNAITAYAKKHGYVVKRDGTFGYKGGSKRIQWTATREDIKRAMKKKSRKNSIAAAIERDFPGIK